jgi:hypothetical protein
MVVSSDLRPLLTDLSILLVFDGHRLRSKVGSRGQCLCSHGFFYFVTSRLAQCVLSYLEAPAYFSKICMVIFWKSCSFFLRRELPALTVEPVQDKQPNSPLSYSVRALQKSAMAGL